MLNTQRYKSRIQDINSAPRFSVASTWGAVAILCFPFIMIGCNSNEPEQKKGPKPTLITVAQIKKAPIEITEQTIGSLEGLIDPTIAAEVAARVIKVHVNPGDVVKQGQLVATLDATDFTLQRNEAGAEVARVQALLENQAKTVARNQTLVDKKFISQNAVDTEVANQKVLNQQLAAARARVASINNNSTKTRVVSPINGVVEKQLVGTGDFVNVGSPIVQIISKQKLRAHLPFPEAVSAQLKPGLTVRLSTPTSPKTIESKIEELKPLINEGNRTVDVIADVLNEAGWQPGASVMGVVVLGESTSAMMAPEQSVVLRPAGNVVYVIKNNIAHQAIVQIGVRQNGLIEIQTGLNENDVIAVDGAGFLTDLAPITLNRETKNNKYENSNLSSAK